MKFLKTKVPIEDFTPQLLAATIDSEGKTSLPESAATSYIRSAAIEFARRTQILKNDITVDLQCGLKEYPLETDDCEKVVAIVCAQYENWMEEDCGCAWSFGDVRFQLDDGILHIDPAPNEDIPGGLKLKVVTIPNRDACELDSRLFDEWQDAIVEGALSRLYSMPSRPWSSMSRSDYSRRLFNEAIGMANVSRVMSGHRGPLKMSMTNSWRPGKTRQNGW